MTLRFEFHEGFQRSLLRLAMIDDHFNVQAQKHLRPDYFTAEALGWIWKMLHEHFVRYGRSCQDVSLREYAIATHNDVYNKEVDAVIALGHSIEADFIRDKLREFVQRNLFTKAFYDSQASYNLGKLTTAFDEMRKAMDEITSINFDRPQRSYFFEELPERQRRRSVYSLDPSEGVYTTGVMPLDKSLGGGIRESELHAVFSYAKIGKSTWLVNQGFHAAFVSRVPVLHIQLEGSLKELEDRYEACFANLLHSEVRVGDIDASLYQQLMEDYRRLRGLLILRSFDDLDINVSHIAAEMFELEPRGFRPKILITDYADLLRARHPAGTENEHQTAGTRDLKRLCVNKNLAGWTAFQARRPETKGLDQKEHIITSSMVADSYSKIRIVDSYGSINQTAKEHEQGQWRLYWEACRSARVNKLFRLYNDPDRMRIALRVEELKRNDNGHVVTDADKQAPYADLQNFGADGLG